MARLIEFDTLMLHAGQHAAIEDCGHMMFSEKPEETHRALVELITNPAEKTTSDHL